MILKFDNETVLDAIERTGRTFSANPLITTDAEHVAGNLAMLYELVGVLASEVRRLEVLAVANPKNGEKR